MNCRRYREEIQTLAESPRISPSKSLQAHLEKCAKCRERKENLISLCAGLRALTPVQPSADFNDRLFRRIREEEAAKDGLRRTLGLQARYWRIEVAGAGLIALLLAVTVLGRVDHSFDSTAGNRQLQRSQGQISAQDDDSSAKGDDAGARIPKVVVKRRANSLSYDRETAKKSGNKTPLSVMDGEKSNATSLNDRALSWRPVPESPGSMTKSEIQPYHDRLVTGRPAAAVPDKVLLSAQARETDKTRSGPPADMRERHDLAWMAPDVSNNYGALAQKDIVSNGAYTTVESAAAGLRQPFADISVDKTSITMSFVSPAVGAQYKPPSNPLHMDFKSGDLLFFRLLQAPDIYSREWVAVVPSPMPRTELTSFEDSLSQARAFADRTGLIVIAPSSTLYEAYTAPSYAGGTTSSLAFPGTLNVKGHGYLLLLPQN